MREWLKPSRITWPTTIEGILDAATAVRVFSEFVRSLPPRFKVDVNVTPGTHASEEAVNKQLNDNRAAEKEKLWFPPLGIRKLLGMLSGRRILRFAYLPLRRWHSPLFVVRSGVRVASILSVN